MRLVTQQSNQSDCPRPFVKYLQSGGTRRIEVYEPKGCTTPLVSVIIPTVGSARSEYLANLLSQLEEQTFHNFEVILVIGDNRQGRAINCGAAQARGAYLLILDDDTSLGSVDLIARMVAMVQAVPNIGMAGVANTIPPHASRFVRRVMQEIPRRTSPIVQELTDSDLAEHPCCLIPKSLFYQIGGENELIPRGLDPYLRQAIRQAGYRVVVLPQLFIHHLPPAKFSKFVKQFYRNGKMAAYVNKFYPQFLVELTTQHDQAVPPQRSIFKRITSYGSRLILAIATGKIYFLISSLLYLVGFIVGYLTLKAEDV